MSFPNINLLTGIPRSGTTLCCKLLNARNDVIALHEPIRPGTIPNGDSKDALVALTERFKHFEAAIASGSPFEHGDKGGLGIENPVGMVATDGVRQVVAKRGEVVLPKREPGSYQLVIKQNAMFTALLPQLSKRFSLTCIVRNPVDVLLSWLTVDLPVNRGRIPGGERFDNALKLSLDNCKERLERQLIIYQWFVSQFLASGCDILRYEDVITSSGAALDKSLNLRAIERETLHKQARQFSEEVLGQLTTARQGLLSLDCGSLYNSHDIEQALALHGL